MLFDPSTVVDPSWPQPPLKPTEQGWKEGELAKDFDELMVALIPNRVFQGLDDKIGVGNHFPAITFANLHCTALSIRPFSSTKLRFRWINHAGLLWSRIYSEVDRQREEVEIEPDTQNDGKNRSRQQRRLDPPEADVRAEMVLKHAHKKDRKR